MNLTKEILNNDLYKEVLELCNSRNIDLQIRVYPDNSPESRIGMGFTNYNRTNKTIEIGIIESYLNDEIVIIHELLHAKIHVMGYPSIERYSKAEFHPLIDQVLSSIQNTVHHTLVYPLIETLGKNQNDVDNQYFSFIERELNEKVEGVSKLATVANLLEAYVRDPLRTGHIISKIRNTHQQEVNVYFEMREVVNHTKSPIEMYRVFCKLIRIINEYIKKVHNEEVFLNVLVKVNPVFDEDLLLKKASEVLYTLKLKGYPHVFVMDRSSDNCCIFLSNHGSSLDKDYVDQLLRQYKLKDFLSLL